MENKFSSGLDVMKTVALTMHIEYGWSWLGCVNTQYGSWFNEHI